MGAWKFIIHHCRTVYGYGRGVMGTGGGTWFTVYMECIHKVKPSERKLHLDLCLIPGPPGLPLVLLPLPCFMFMFKSILLPSSFSIPLLVFSSLYYHLASFTHPLSSSPCDHIYPKTVKP